MKLGKTATEAHILLKLVNGNDSLSRTQVFDWFKPFKQGQEEIKDDPCPGRPSTLTMDENIEKNGTLVRKDIIVRGGIILNASIGLVLSS